MSPLTIDPNDPRIGKGVDAEQVPQSEAYLVLSQAELDIGFTRPVRLSYVHVGPESRHPLRDLTEEEQERFPGLGYVKFEEYPESESPKVGRFWTQEQLDERGGCGTVTTMALKIAETYARDPKFYGSTYCTKCRKHLPVSEFRWGDRDGDVVGS